MKKVLATKDKFAAEKLKNKQRRSFHITFNVASMHKQMSNLPKANNISEKIKLFEEENGPLKAITNGIRVNNELIS